MIVHRNGVHEISVANVKYYFKKKNNFLFADFLYFYSIILRACLYFTK